MTITTQDPLAVCDNLAHVATDDAFKRMCREALAGRSCSWKIWIRPAYIHGDQVFPAAPYIGEEALNSGYRAIKDIRIHGGMSGNQMFNAVRFKLREAPLWATQFIPEHANLLENP